MKGPDKFDDGSGEHERFETELVAQDRDAVQIPTEDVDRDTAHHLVSDLVDAGVVTPVPDQPVLVHDPSGEAFDSIVQLAVFHRGWMAARDDREEET